MPGVLVEKRLVPKRIRLERMASATHEQKGAPMWALVAAGGDHAEAKRLLEVRRLQRTRGNVRVAGRTNRGAANVGKRLVDEQTKTSVAHLAGVGTGMAAIAWGGSRSKGLRRALRAGGASPELDPSVRRALNLAEHTRQGIEHSTEGLGRVTGRGIGRMPGPLRNALNEVPRSLRPATATLAGAILVQHSQPVRRKSYSPVVNYGSY